jgi:hypothetical protein
MAKKKKLNKWTDVYPVGTPEGDEEARFFKALVRNKKYEWRSTAALIKESGLSKIRVDEIITKYHKKGMIFQSKDREDHWAYWERVPDMLPDDQASIAKKDQDSRIDKLMKEEEPEYKQLTLFNTIADTGTNTVASVVPIQFYVGLTSQFTSSEWVYYTAPDCCSTVSYAS